MSSWKFKHDYWGEDWQDATQFFYKDQNVLSPYAVAEMVCQAYFEENAEDCTYLEEPVDIMSPEGDVSKFTVIAEMSMRFNAYKRKEKSND